MIQSHIILAAAWILYCTLHSVLASSKFKQLAAGKMGRQFKYYRLYYVIFAIATLVPLLIYQVRIRALEIFRPPIFSSVIGILIATVGLVVMAVCVVKYFMQLSGLKGLIREQSNNELMITGIHKYVRHPLYAATFVFIWGLFILFPFYSSLIANAVITTYTLIALRFEEQKLEREFGSVYTLYKQKVPMIIPRLSK